MRQVSATIAFLSTLWESRSMAHHNEIVRESFTAQAKAFAANPWVTDKQRIRRLVAAARLTGNERVLDIATGPGYIAEAFARAARDVIGVDLTAAMLAIGEERFGPAEESVKAQLHSIGDLERLERMHRRAVKAANWQEILETP